MQTLAGEFRTNPQYSSLGEDRQTKVESCQDEIKIAFRMALLNVELWCKHMGR
jgi:hypothetical protein